MFNVGLLRGTRSLGFGLCNALDGCQHMLANFGFVAAYREPELGVVRNDVVLGAGLNVSDRQNGDFTRFYLAGNDGLKRDDKPRRDHDWINRTVGHGAVSALAIDRNSK